MKNFLASITFCLLTLSCSSHGPDLKMLESQLLWSQEQATSFKPGDPEIKKLQEKVIKTFSEYSIANLQKHLPKLYSEDAYLNDRLAEFKGRESINAYFYEASDKIARGEFIFQDASQQGIEFYFAWIMKISPKSSPDETWSFHGMSRMRFNSEGKIIFHYDYWDVSEFMSHISIASPIVSLFKK